MCYSISMSYKLTKEKYLNDDELNRLVHILTKFQESNPRDTTLIWLALHTGARAGEVLDVRLTDLDLSQKSVYIRGTKGSDDRDIPLPHWLFKKLLALIPGHDDRLFPISYIRFSQIWGEYRPVKKKLHALRHTFAVNLYRKSKDIRLLQLALGHRNWNNTMIYAAYQYKTDELRRVLMT